MDRVAPALKWPMRRCASSSWSGSSRPWAGTGRPGLRAPALKRKQAVPSKKISSSTDRLCRDRSQCFEVRIWTHNWKIVLIKVPGNLILDGAIGVKFLESDSKIDLFWLQFKSVIKWCMPIKSLRHHSHFESAEHGLQPEGHGLALHPPEGVLQPVEDLLRGPGGLLLLGPLADVPFLLQCVNVPGLAVDII